jgi:menaquinone-dependent protoporphyrinogen oxidase
MKTLIVYASRHGCTEKCTIKLEDKLAGTVERVNLKSGQRVNLTGYDTVVIGSPIYAGQIPKEVKHFCEEHQKALLGSKLGLFICCGYEGDKAQEQFDQAFSKDLRDHASAKGLFGGEFSLEKMNFFERFAVKKAAKVTRSISNIHEEAIRKFADEIQE